MCSCTCHNPVRLVSSSSQCAANGCCISHLCAEAFKSQCVCCLSAFCFLPCQLGSHTFWMVQRYVCTASTSLGPQVTVQSGALPPLLPPTPQPADLHVTCSLSGKNILSYIKLLRLKVLLLPQRDLVYPDSHSASA